MWSSSVSQAFDNDPTLKDILASTYTSSRRRNFAVVNGADKSLMPLLEELIQQSFNLLLIGNDEATLEYLKDEWKDILDENELNLTTQFIIVKQDEWQDKDTIAAIDDTINGLDFPCLLINNYRFYNDNFTVPVSSTFSITGIGSPSMMVYQSMMKSFPLTWVTDIIGKSFYAMEKSRGVDLEDTTDPTKYAALDSLVLQKTKSGQKRAMKKLALLNIREHIKEIEDLNKKSESEQKFLEEHPEHMIDQREADEEANTGAAADNEEVKEDHDYWQMIDEYTVREQKVWDCYQLFCKLINYKYNPYDDQELEEYLALQEVNDQTRMAATAGTSWPFGK